jgi:hypothetical protein
MYMPPCSCKNAEPDNLGFHEPSCVHFDPAWDAAVIGLVSDNMPPITCGTCGDSGLVDDEPCFDCSKARQMFLV